MKTGFRGTYVISWKQTELDGLDAAPLWSLTTGAVWSWRGEAVRVDGPAELLCLGRTDDEDTLRKKAARKVRRMVGAAVQHRTDVDGVELDDPLMDQSFVVTNGAQSFTITLIEPGTGAHPLLMFHDQIPPRETDLWVVHQTHCAVDQARAPSHDGGVICFTPGTQIDTPDGPRAVEELREGDLVQTRDNGAQEIRWIGQRRMSGARLFVMPELRPIRFSADALDVDRPDTDLLVSPEHRMLVRGPVAKALFNTPEVLVPARQLVNDSSVTVDLSVREVTYVHLLLSSHQIVWANGVETESFHPASASLSALTDEDRGRLLQQMPALESNPHSYGDFARRNLSASEATLLTHEVA